MKTKKTTKKTTKIKKPKLSEKDTLPLLSPSDLLQMTPAQFCAATNAFDDCREFALTQPTIADVWDKCPRADWMLWIANKIGRLPEERTLRMFAVWCARHTPLADGRKIGDLFTDARSLNALEVSERYANGQATKQEVDAAWDAASAAARATTQAAPWVAARTVAPSTAWGVARDAVYGAASAAGWDAAWVAQAAQLRTLMPNPFRRNGS